jgi:Ca2+-transporting ATPase
MTTTLETSTPAIPVATGPAASDPHAWHAMPVSDVLRALSSTPAGLSAEIAARRLAEVGPNALQPAPRASPWRLLAAQFRNVLIVILVVATALSAVLGHAVEAIAITVIVLFAVLLGFVQEFRAERAIEALRAMAAPRALVVRDGRELEVASAEVVPGDVLALTAGNRVAADARVLEAVNLQAQESALTGESLSVDKSSDASPAGDVPVGDRRSLVHAGTTITYGRGTAVVVRTGPRTEFGRIAGMLA